MNNKKTRTKHRVFANPAPVTIETLASKMSEMADIAEERYARDHDETCRHNRLMEVLYGERTTVMRQQFGADICKALLNLKHGKTPAL